MMNSTQAVFSVALTSLLRIWYRPTTQIASIDVLGNAATKIVLPVDQVEVKKVAAKFRFAEQKVAALLPLTALCRFGKHAEQVEILPYYQRVADGRDDA